MNIGLFIFCVIGFVFSLFSLITVIREAKNDPTAAGLAVYIGGISFVSCIMCILGAITFIIECLV